MGSEVRGRFVWPRTFIVYQRASPTSLMQSTNFQKRLHPCLPARCSGQPDLIPPFLFGLIHRSISLSRQLHFSVPVLGVDSDADTAANADVLSINQEWLTQRGPNFFSDGKCAVFIVNFTQKNHEFITPDAGDCVGFTNATQHP